MARRDTSHRELVLEGHSEDAIPHFRAALSLRPGWQVGAIALSHALHVSGARDEARRVLVEGLTVPHTNENLFGWWSYETGLIDRFGPLMERLRDEVMAW